MRDLPYLVPLMPGEGREVPTGRTIRWPGEDQAWVWDGSRWVTTFDGGDSWLEIEDSQDEAA